MMARLLLSIIIFGTILVLTMAWDFHHNLHVPREHNVMRRSVNTNYTNILKFWAEHKNKLSSQDKYKEVVLVMGNTGAGKSTVISAVTGRKLRAIRKNAELVIVDEEDRIGTGVSSKTLIPEAIRDGKRNVTYIDCPGFRDNRDIEYEISSIYFQNILMNQVSKVKLILIINYSSLTINGNKNDFDDLFEHIGEFIKDISKFNDGIALVATKVNNRYEWFENGTSYLANTNQLVLDGIAYYLEHKKEIYRSKQENVEKYKRLADLIDVLLQKRNDAYTRIAIFRNPIGQGLLENMRHTKQSIKTITEMIVKNLNYVEKRQDDFGFVLSKSSKNVVEQIVDDIFSNALTNRLLEMGNETLTHYLQIEKQYSDINMLRKRVSQAYKVISGITNVDEPLALFKEFLNATNTLNISVSLTNLNIISEDIKSLRFFTTVLNRNMTTHMLLLEKEMHKIVKSLKNLKNVYDFLNNLQADLAAYKSQKLKNDNRIANIIKSCANVYEYKFVEDITDLENIVKEIGRDEIYQKIRTIKLNQFQLKHLKAILGAFSSKLEFSCTPSSSQVTVKGYNVRMSDVVEIDRNCSLQAKNIQLFALNKVFIDRTIDKTGAEAQIFILAPTWEVIGAPKIILDGKTGEPHRSASAKSSEFTSENGENGLPGLPGGPAGNFFGVGKQFINIENLKIHANGGNGGPGQHGGNGADGIAGEGLSDSFFQLKRSPDDIRKYFKEHNYKYNMVMISGQQQAGKDYIDSTEWKYTVDVFGKPAKRPTDGGDGGAGGKGGYPGRIVINGLGHLVNYKTSNNSGSTGSKGQGGHGGKSTLEGRRVKFDYRHVYYLSIPLFANTKYQNINWMDGAKVSAGKDGEPGGNKKYEKNPRKTTSVMSLFLAINSFKDFVRSNLLENIKELELRALIYEIENDSQIRAQYNTLAFVKELVGLENQFIELKNRIDFVPFYDSLLNRIEKFAMSERILENKKVLSYIYTAALTKVLTLKKKRKGKTVVNLEKYLRTIEEIVNKIHDFQQLQIVQDYRDDYNKEISNKIREANAFIENKIEPEISGLWEESNHQIKAILGEIKQGKNTTENILISKEKYRVKIRDIMHLRASLLPLKLAASGLSFLGPVGASVGAAVTSVTTISEGMLLDTTSNQGQNKLYSLDPNLKLMSRVTEVLNNKPQLLADKLAKVVAKLDEYKEDLSITQEEKIEISQKVGNLKTKVTEVQNRKASRISEIELKKKDAESIEKEIKDLINSRQDILDKEKKRLQDMKAEQENAQKIKEEKQLETRLRRINHVQSVMNGVETVFSFIKKIENDKGMIRNIDCEISDSVDELRNMEKLEDQVYNVLIPDLRQIEQTVNQIKTSLHGSSHIKLDLTKWTVRKTLREVKSLLQKFTHKMSFELQINLMRFMEKLDEAFSILIDIYDRIDSYSDSVKQAEYIAHIVSTPMANVRVTNPELNDAVIELGFIIQSNLLFEMYGIAIHAFKQHFFPFAADVLQGFHLPTNMRLNDTEILRSHIIEKIHYMKNHIEESEATIDQYSKFIHENTVFNSNITGSSPFYVWKHDTIKDEVQRLLNGSEILIKADISRGPNYNSIKYTDIGIHFKLKDEILQKKFNAVLKNFGLVMVMVGNNYYRCGERYYCMSFVDSINISYTLNQDEAKNWIDPNLVYTTIRKSHPFLSPYGMWSIKLKRVDNSSVSFDNLKVFANEAIDLELIGRGYYIEQDSYFNFNVCNEYLDEFYNVENIAKEL